MGVDLVSGDITEPDDVRRAAEGCEAAIHTAALLGAANQDLAEFEAVNTAGTTHVLDAAADGRHAARRGAQHRHLLRHAAAGSPLEDAPVAEQTSDDPYNQTKLAAFNEAHARAAAGQDVVTCHPGAIFGPAPVVSRALAMTSFNRVLRGALRGKLTGLPAVPRHRGCSPPTWRGARSPRSTGACRASATCSRVGPRTSSASPSAATGSATWPVSTTTCEDLEPSDDPELTAAFGPTLVAIAGQASRSNGSRRGPAPHRRSPRLRPHLARRRSGAAPRLAARPRPDRLTGARDETWLDAIDHLVGGNPRRADGSARPLGGRARARPRPGRPPRPDLARAPTRTGGSGPDARRGRCG